MILNETDIKKYLPLQTQGVSTKFEGFELRALYKHFPRFIGQTLTDSLAEANPDVDLMAKAAPAWIVITFMESVPFLDVVSTNTGFGVVRSNTVAPASRERVDALRAACELAANDYMDQLLLFLEENAATYADWNQSCLNEGSLISSVSVFDEFVDINVSRSKFIQLKREINQLEITTFLNKLSPEFLTELQSGSDMVVKPLIQRALAFFALAKLEQSEDPEKSVNKLVRSGEDAFNRAFSYLNDHLDDYLTYYTYGYEAPYDNEVDGEDSGFFIGGATA